RPPARGQTKSGFLLGGDQQRHCQTLGRRIDGGGMRKPMHCAQYSTAVAIDYASSYQKHWQMAGLPRYKLYGLNTSPNNQPPTIYALNFGQIEQLVERADGMVVDGLGQRAYRRGAPLFVHFGCCG